MTGVWGCPPVLSLFHPIGGAGGLPCRGSGGVPQFSLRRINKEPGQDWPGSLFILLVRKVAAAPSLQLTQVEAPQPGVTLKQSGATTGGRSLSSPASARGR